MNARLAGLRAYQQYANGARVKCNQGNSPLSAGAIGFTFGQYHVNAPFRYADHGCGSPARFEERAADRGPDLDRSAAPPG